MLRSMVIQDVHVNPLSSASKEGFLILALVDAVSNAGNDQCARIDSFEITPRHLQD